MDKGVSLQSKFAAFHISSNKFKKKIVNGSEKFYCPYSDCSTLLINDPLEVLTELPCPACKRHFCVQCKVAWHSGVDMHSVTIVEHLQPVLVIVAQSVITNQ
ncbi:Zinc finger, C6HC-type [Corchorus capsularis]|uniref:Zinc finger, C6HC-type n=1 Tax=Corchorus capsularis TaxID=210143 RepID=A0A1R3H9W4_COCAP|nr:Zinc finger, C6HC-type [Corchorus capsularis]